MIVYFRGRFFRIFPLFFLCISYLPAKAYQSEELDLRVMSFNIRNSYARDGENDWKHRKELVYQTIRDYSPAILGLQEANHVQQNELLTALPEYEFVGIGAKGGTKGQYCSILYLKNRFKVEKTETYWLSDTPTVPSSTWGNHHLRIFTYARLVEKETGHIINIYNCHLDDGSKKAREKSVRQIGEHILQQPSNEPFVFMGDFNAPENSVTIQQLGNFKTQQEEQSILPPIPSVCSILRKKMWAPITATKVIPREIKLIPFLSHQPPRFWKHPLSEPLPMIVIHPIIFP